MRHVLKFVLLIALFGTNLYAESSRCAIGALIISVKHENVGQLTVLGVMPNSPAARAGLAQGQIVRAINGVPTDKLKPSDCVQLIQGDAGTRVVLLVEDRQHGWTNSLEMNRKVIEGDPLAVAPDGFDIPQSARQASLSVTTNQVIRVVIKSGSIAMIQFTELGTTNANYRWRAYSAGQNGVMEGTGSVREYYEKKANPFGGYQLINVGSPDDLFVKAGEVRLQWSSNNLTNCWLYYYPSKERIEVLDSAEFNIELR